MKEHPIIFDAESMRANLAGTKTQTRRVLKTQPGPYADFYNLTVRGNAVFTDGTVVPCPWAVPGDRIWGREIWGVYRLHTDNGGSEYPNVLYRADSSTRLLLHDDVWKYDADPMRWRSPIFMPRWACRFVAEVVAVWVERLWGISETDAIAEGIDMSADYPAYCQCGGTGILPAYAGRGVDVEMSVQDCHCTTVVGRYRARWDAINGKRAPWASNPWVWVIEYRPVQP